jgi:hypothetical protein
MIVHSFDSKIASIELTLEEVWIVNNALNEVCNGIHLKGDFPTRMGCSVEEAREILNKINGLGSDMQSQVG